MILTRAFAAGLIAASAFASTLALGRRVLARGARATRPSVKFIKASLAAVIASGVCLITSNASAAVSLQGLGFLPGGVYSRAQGVSADGSTVVGYGNSGSGEQAFSWTSGAGMVGLGDLAPEPFESRAAGVSANGAVVVGTGGSTSFDEAFRWTSDGGTVGLGYLYPAGAWSRAYASSGDGSVVVGFGNSPSTDMEAFRWTSGGGMVGLGLLPHGQFSFAYGVSGDGSVVVGESNSDPYSNNFYEEAFRWTSDGGMIGLGGDNSIAYGVSADGAVVIGENNKQAFRWTSGGGMVGLGYLRGKVDSAALAVSGDGSVVVGESGDRYGANDAFRWTSDGGMERLWDVLLANGVDPAANGWTSLAEASGVSFDGNSIVGLGYHNGRSEAFLAVVPEPAALSGSVLAGCILLCRARSHQARHAA